MGRAEHPGFEDVRQHGAVLGFVAPESGKWVAYLDFRHKAGSAPIGTYDSKGAAISAVRRGSLG